MEVPEGKIFTSSMAVAQFLNRQKPHGKAFVIGESGLTSPIHYVGYIITDLEPDYVVLGETFAYNLDLVTKAIRFIANGARFIATNPDVSDVTVNGIVPACGAMAALIEKTTGVSPFFVGKPNPLMMRMALNYINAHSEETVMVGDRMDTDIVAGLTSGMETILVLSGVTQRSDIPRYPYQPNHVRESVKEIEVYILKGADTEVRPWGRDLERVPACCVLRPIQFRINACYRRCQRRARCCAGAWRWSWVPHRRAKA